VLFGASFIDENRFFLIIFSFLVVIYLVFLTQNDYLAGLGLSFIFKTQNLTLLLS